MVESRIVPHRSSAELPGRGAAVRAAAQHAGLGPAAAVRPPSDVAMILDAMLYHRHHGS